MVATFCINLGDDVGGCVVKCDPDDPQCLDGQHCAPEVRYGRTSPTAHVCIAND
jgi:hypothetical protein